MLLYILTLDEGCTPALATTMEAHPLPFDNWHNDNRSYATAHMGKGIEGLDAIFSFWRWKN